MSRTTRPYASLPVALFVLALTFAVAGPPAVAADWSRWLGPTQDSRAAGPGLSAGKSVGFEVAWRRTLGIGYTGIAVAGGTAVTMFADGTNDWLVAVDPRSGDERWRYDIGAMYPAQGGSEGGPAGFPVVADGVVYGLGAAGHLFAVRLEDGKEVWKVRIDETLGARPAMFGFSTVPLVAGAALFVQAGGDQGRSLVAFDRATGEVLWSAGDDRVGYGSPMLASFDGVEQIVAHTNTTLYGLDPRSGNVLWSLANGKEESDDSVGTPVFLDSHRFFLNGDTESRAFVVTQEGGTWRADEAWVTRAMKGSLATPVHHKGHLYGFDGDFMTCISAADGTKVWKSRPPGGRGLILVDEQLLIFANNGAMVAVEATPEGYREAGRLELADTGTWTYPSFADGLIFVRNTKEFAAIAARPLVLVAAKPEGTAAPRNAFERFVQRVEASDAKRPLVDEFMAAQTQFPVVEDGWVHFVYRGEADDVAMTGSMTEYQVEEALRRVAGTDLFYRSYAVEPATRWEYRFNVDFENRQPDPLNPRRILGREGESSEVTTAGWNASAWMQPYTAENAGRVERFTLASKIMENERLVDVYLPAGYDGGDERFPLVVATDGQGWHDFGKLPNVLDHISGRSAKRMIVALVHQPERAGAELAGPKSDDYVRMLADELVPKLDATYRTEARADSRAMLGAGSGGTMAAYVAVSRPDVFGKVAAMSVYLGSESGSKLIAAAESFDAARSRPVFEIARNRVELRRADWNADIARDTDRLAETLEQHGFRVAAREAVDSSGWGAWPVRAGELLAALFPPS